MHLLANRTARKTAVVVAVLMTVLLPQPALSKPEKPAQEKATEPADAEAEAKSQARSRFERGLGLMKSKKWNRALTEFIESRGLYPSRGNTQNAAVCLRELGRYDESLEMFETLLKEFEQLTAAERQNVREEITFLRSQVGSVEILILEPGADVMIDGRQRGRTPLSVPMRVTAGAHVVRVYKQGFAPFEARVQVEARKTASVDGVLKKLTRSGQLKVAVAGDEVVDVLVDGVVVGQTPWEGTLAVGAHSVTLRGAGHRGTAPVAATVKEDDVTALTLEVTALEAELRIQPQPINAAVALDSVQIGRGIWDGRLPAGEHRIEVAAEGFLPAKRELSLEAGQRQVLLVELERDPESELWAEKTLPRVIFDLHLAPALAPLVGGDLVDACTGSCSAGLGVGGLAMLRGGYQFAVGIGLTLDVGYLMLHQAIEQRPGVLVPRGLAPNAGLVDDDLLLMGLLAGASGSFQVGAQWPFQARVGGGIFFGSLRDERSGTFTTNLDPTAYEVGPLSESPSMTYAYVSPELRIGYRLTEALILSLSAQGLFLFALNQPEWVDEQDLLAGQCDGSAPSQCEGLAAFGPQSVAGKTIIAVAPGLALKLEL